MDHNQGKEPQYGASCMAPEVDCTPDEREVLDQLSEHFKQINEILEIVEREQNREAELSVNCDSLDRLTPPNLNLPSPGLRSSLTSPINSRVIDDLIRDSVQDGDPLISPTCVNDIEDDSPVVPELDDAESRTRRTLQTLAHLAELVDKNNLALAKESSSSYASNADDCTSDRASPEKSKPYRHLHNFRPQKPLLLVSKVRAGLELLKKRQLEKARARAEAKRQEKLKKKVQLLNEHAEKVVNSSKKDENILPPTCAPTTVTANNPNSQVQALQAPIQSPIQAPVQAQVQTQVQAQVQAPILASANAQPQNLQNIILVQVDNQLVPICVIPQTTELISNQNNTQITNNQPVIFIPNEPQNSADSIAPGSTNAQSFISIPHIPAQPVVSIDSFNNQVNCPQNQFTNQLDNHTFQQPPPINDSPTKVNIQTVHKQLQDLNDETSSNLNDETLSNLNDSVLSNDSNKSDDSLAVAMITETSSDGSELSLSLKGKSDKEEFKCQHCMATFNRFCNFSKHLLVHDMFLSEQDLYKCEFCGRKFLQRCDLNRHRLVHNGEEPHRCNVCNKAYIRKSDLVVHQRYHTKEKPFICKTCNKGFAQSGDLSRHVRRVHEKAAVIRCGHCKRVYAKEATLMRHMKMAHQDVMLKSLVEQQLQKDT